MYLSLYSDDEELHGETQDVTRVQPVPDCQEKKRGHMRQGLVAKELQSFENMSEIKEEREKFLKIVDNLSFDERSR